VREEGVELLSLFPQNSHGVMAAFSDGGTSGGSGFRWGKKRGEESPNSVKASTIEYNF